MSYFIDLIQWMALQFIFLLRDSENDPYFNTPL